jgi:very-short-patch-repair endonuclease
MFRSFCERYGLPVPLFNQSLLGYEVDAYYPAHRLVVECDGYDAHRDKARFESDRKQDADLLVAEIETVRLTWDRLTLTPDPEADRLRKLLARRVTWPLGE